MAALAEEAGAVTPERAQQAALFEAMRAAPDDAEAALAYARASASIEDFEAAISTFERALSASLPESRVAQQLRLELAAYYFKIGSYGVAGAYLLQAEQGPPMSPRTAARAAALSAEVDKRMSRHRFDGFLDLGLVATDNAGLSARTDVYQPYGVTTYLGAESDPESDIGARARFSLRHRYDLGQPDGDYWQTQVNGASITYFDETDASNQAVGLRSGPVLSLDPFRYGPKLQPFVETSAGWRGGEAEQLYAGGGARVSQAFTDTWFAAASVSAGERWILSGGREDERDALVLRGVAEAAYTPTRRTVLRARAHVSRDIADAEAFSNVELGLWFSARQGYDPGLTDTERLWSVSAHVGPYWRRYDRADIAIDPDRREDYGVEIGVSHTAWLTNDWSLEFDVSHRLRRSNVAVYEFDATRVGAALRFNF